MVYKMKMYTALLVCIRFRLACLRVCMHFDSAASFLIPFVLCVIHDRINEGNSIFAVAFDLRTKHTQKVRESERYARVSNEQAHLQ